MIIPIENTLLYVEPIYQTLVNEKSQIPVLKKVIVASGNKITIGDNFREALTNLLSEYAAKIEIVDTEDMDDLIEAIIKAKNNLKESSETNNWELMGKDIQTLQELLDKLEKVKEVQDKKVKDNTHATNSSIDGILNEIFN